MLLGEKSACQALRLYHGQAHQLKCGVFSELFLIGSEFVMQKCTCFWVQLSFNDWKNMFNLIQTKFPPKPVRIFRIASHKMTFDGKVKQYLALRSCCNCFACCQEPERTNRCSTATVKEGRPRGDVVFHVLTLINTRTSEDLGHLLCINLLINNSWCCTY